MSDVKKLVESWFPQNYIDSQTAAVDCKVQPRPARLGPGASFSKASSTEASKFRKTLMSKKEEKQAFTKQQEYSDDEESRSKNFEKKKTEPLSASKNKKKKQKFI